MAIWNLGDLISKQRAIVLANVLDKYAVRTVGGPDNLTFRQVRSGQLWRGQNEGFARRVAGGEHDRERRARSNGSFVNIALFGPLDH